MADVGECGLRTRFAAIRPHGEENRMYSLRSVAPVRRLLGVLVRIVAMAAVTSVGLVIPQGRCEALAEPSWGQSGIPILIYHNVFDTPDLYAVTAEQLESQLIWLRDNGYVGITPSQLLAAHQSGAPLPDKPVMLTIDDGWPSQTLFVDMVNRYGFAASYFLPNYASVTPDEIRALDASGEVCGHTVNHQHLDQLSYEEAYREVYDNKVWLEGILGSPVTCFAYPFGGYNETAIRAVRDAGMQTAFLAWGGLNSLDASLDLMTIRRINVNGAYPLDDFIAVINGAVGY
jgi:peptidoglycan/xylan/chitin deacetylase (PgdA/CDA1 family)